jgi:4-hydroxythreonine-4-phosphate dehydrogenase
MAVLRGPADRPSRPAVAAVIGDPTGIGPEVLVKALAGGLDAHVLVVGDTSVWDRAQQVAGTDLPPRLTDRPGPVGPDVPFFQIEAPDALWTVGEVSPVAGVAAAVWLTAAVRFALDRTVDAVVFAPLNKQAIIRGGFKVRDEYELCASLAGIAEYAEMNVIPHPAGGESNRLLWVARATSHVALKDVPALLTVDRVTRTIRHAAEMAKAAGTPAPRVGVAALNPHAGEGGALGDEETHVIAPAIAAAVTDGIDATGPHPADHVFRLARAGQFDVVVSMYHDQAQIAAKLLGFERGVSVGIGYPFVMTTPSHGTAFDIVGQGVADPGPMRQALLMAERLVRSRPI